jgi:hypothetical protein
MLVRCLYASRAAQPLVAPILESILAQSRKNNPARGITGLLCVSGELFIQALEGGRDEICELFYAITRDERHKGVRLLIYEEIRQRKFGNWTMGHVDLTKINPSLLLRYHETAELNPFNCSGEATMALLDQLVATASVVHRTG